MRVKQGSIKVIITGVTGMVGEGVLHQCLQRPEVSEVLMINRRHYDYSHPKLKEVIHADFFNLFDIEEHLLGYDACYFCLGVSSVGMSADDYYKFTYTLTLGFANVLSRLNHNMVFCYVSGAGTDSTEKGGLRWARVKGKTENDLMRLPFEAVYNFRPGIIKPTPGLKNTHKFYNWFGWLFPVVKIFSAVCSLKQIGNAMVYVTLHGYQQHNLEVKDIIKIGGAE